MAGLTDDKRAEYEVSICQICQTDSQADVIMDLGDCIVSRCKKCGFVYINGDRSVETEEKRYRKDLFEQEGYLRNYDIDKISSEQLESTLSILRRAGVAGGISNEWRVLDVGCARGHFLNLISSHISKSNLVGCDTSGDMVDWGIEEFGLDLRATAIENAELPSNHFELVTMFDVLEHVAFPRVLLDKIMLVLTPGGWGVIEVPSEVTLFRMMAKVAYRATGGLKYDMARNLYHPAHLSYFTRRSLRTLLMDLGFQGINIVSKEAHVTRFGLDRFSVPKRIAVKAVSVCDRLLGTQAKLLCAFQKPVKS